MEYPKIETLYNRDPKTFKVIVDQIRLPEFDNVRRWHVTEKVDGTNIRVMWDGVKKELTFGGRTDNAQMPTSLVTYLQQTFTPDMFAAFDGSVTLFGEGYGEKIQKGGGNYRKGVSFRLFDVLVGSWWVSPNDVADIAQNLNIHTVPSYGIIDYLPKSLDDLLKIDSGKSKTAYLDGGDGLTPEGIVARSYPLMMTRGGSRIMWKLKYRDF